MRSARLGLVLVLGYGCASSSEPDSGAAATLTIISGGAQEAEVGRELSEAIVVRVTDADGRPVPNQIVNFVVISGSGSVFAGTAQTNIGGEARERWTLGTVAGEQVIEARAVDQATGEPIVFGRITATAVPGPMTHLSLDIWVRFFVGEVVDLDSLTHATDQYGNTIPDPPLTVTAAAPWIVNGTKLSSTGEAAGSVTVSSGTFSTSQDFVALRNLNELVGATGGWDCHGSDGAGHTHQSVTFVVDSVRYDLFALRHRTMQLPHVVLITTTTTIWTLENGTTETSPGFAGLYAEQTFGHLYWDYLFPLAGGATLTSESPLAYSGGDGCYGWSIPLNNFTVTR
ncbi:MAG TPA: hypothetical protein VJ808_04010 [Gemmatimonadales bacterium]|nr:hypothetical protein [Gemmatimonadales bacterium]